MYNEHDRTTVVNQSKRDLAPGIPRRRRSFEDFLAGDEHGVRKRKSRKERKIRKESNRRATTTTVELLQSCSDLSPADDSRCIPQISCSPHTMRIARRSSCNGLIQPSSSSRGAPTLPTITEFCSASEAFSPEKASAELSVNMLTWPRRQSPRSYTELLNAISLGSKSNADDSLPSQNARFELSSNANAVMTPKLQSTIIAALSIQNAIDRTKSQIKK